MSVDAFLRHAHCLFQPVGDLGGHAEEAGQGMGFAGADRLCGHVGADGLGG
ncbi:hypothetical protein [Streptomyces cellulosae]|uniref:Uncharacterized protein n=1 Tax=Streptomyces cellulosae TaxID=1968 RepID=A0ABW7YDC5_STRCE